MVRDTRGLVGLGAEELAEELAVELPERPLMRHHRRMLSHKIRFHHVRVFSCSCDCGSSFGFSDRFDRFDGFGFGSVSNVNVTRQSIFNPQTAIGFGGGGISQFGGNINFNSNVQFGF